MIMFKSQHSLDLGYGKLPQISKDVVPMVYHSLITGLGKAVIHSKYLQFVLRKAQVSSLNRPYLLGPKKIKIQRWVVLEA